MNVLKANNLVCPLDNLTLSSSEKQYTCINGHSFDIARQGYVNLLPVQHKASKNPGDSKQMIIARTEFLDNGYYRPIAERLTKVVISLLNNMQQENICILDAGCGEGYYLQYLLENLQLEDNNMDVSCIGMDISKPAIIAAARRNKQITWLVSSNKQPPVIPGTVDMVLCMFGFPVYESFRKLLKPGGKLVLVEPADNHLIELRKIIYPNIKTKPTDVVNDIKQGFSLQEELELTYTTKVDDRQQIQNLLCMTPHLYRASQEGKRMADQLHSIELTIDVNYKVFE